MATQTWGAKFYDAAGPATGLTPTVTTWRQMDGSAAGIAAPAVVEASAANAPGWYTISVTDLPVRLMVTLDGGAGLPAATRYVDLVIDPSDDAITEDRLANLGTPIHAQVWGALAATYTNPATMGGLLRVIAGLAQWHHRVFVTGRTADGQVNAATLKVYPTAADVDTDTNELATITVTGQYAANLLTGARFKGA